MGNEAEGEAGRQDLSRDKNLESDAIEVWNVDLASYDSIVAFSKRAQSLKRLDLVILNGGVFKAKEVLNGTTSSEEDVQINYLSNALLTMQFLSVLNEKKRNDTPGCVELVNSDLDGWSKFEESIQSPLLPASTAKVDKWNSSDTDHYGTSKLLGQYFINELNKNIAASTETVTAYDADISYQSDRLSEETHGSNLVGGEAHHRYYAGPTSYEPYVSLDVFLFSSLPLKPSLSSCPSPFVSIRTMLIIMYRV